MSSVAACCVLCSISLCFVPCAHADCSTATRADSDALAQQLVRERDHAYTWRLTWTAINGGLTLLSLGGLIVLPREQRADLLLSSGVSAVSTAFTWFWPMDVEEDAEAALRIHALPEPDRCMQLERLLAHSAADERDRLTWPWHVGNFITALLPAAVVWFAFHKRGEALLSLLGGFASGEIELLTQPNALSDVVTARFSVRVAEQRFLVGYCVVW
jgi:hypothetical protein